MPCSKMHVSTKNNKVQAGYTARCDVNTFQNGTTSIILDNVDGIDECAVVGSIDGLLLGSLDGEVDGIDECAFVGSIDGSWLGSLDGELEGSADGNRVGSTVGAVVGAPGICSDT